MLNNGSTCIPSTNNTERQTTTICHTLKKKKLDLFSQPSLSCQQQQISITHSLTLFEKCLTVCYQMTIAIDMGEFSQPIYMSERKREEITIYTHFELVCVYVQEGSFFSNLLLIRNIKVCS